MLLIFFSLKCLDLLETLFRSVLPQKSLFIALREITFFEDRWQRFLSLDLVFHLALPAAPPLPVGPVLPRLSHGPSSLLLSPSLAPVTSSFISLNDWDTT